MMAQLLPKIPNIQPNNPSFILEKLRFIDEVPKYTSNQNNHLFSSSKRTILSEMLMISKPVDKTVTKSDEVGLVPRSIVKR